MECIIYSADVDESVDDVKHLIYNVGRKGRDTMSTTPTQIRIDSETKKQAIALFNELGLDMSGAVNLFLKQCVLHGGLPFAVELPRYNAQTLTAMDEARRISRDPNVPAYDSMEALKKALED